MIKLKNFFGDLASYCTLLVICLAAATALAAPTINSKAEENNCKAELLMEAASGDIISSQNAETALAPASMVKVMVAYLTLKKAAEEVVSLDDVVTVSAAASKIGGSQVYLKQGEQFTLKQLLEAVLVQSANDAAYAIAEHIGGTPEGFVELMNIEAKEIGLRDSVFTSPHGLPPGEGQSPDLVSARDMALLSRVLINEFPEVLEVTGLSESSFRDGTFNMRNHNHLVRQYPGCDGLKTGYYFKAGFSVTATAKRNDMRLIAVVMGCKDRKERDAEAARLLSLGFAQYRSIELVPSGASSKQPVPVETGILKQIVPVAEKPLSVVLKIGDQKKVEKTVQTCPSLTAPVLKGTPCGSMAFLLDGREIGRVPLVVPQEVPKLGWTGRIKRMAGF